MDDLISRAAAIAEIEEYIEEYSELEPETGYHNLKWCAMEEAKDVLSMLPTVDAVPVVHGRWTEEETSENTIDEWQSAKCTNCGKYHTTPYLYYFSDYKFCPNCGAKMDGERRDSE